MPLYSSKEVEQLNWKGVVRGDDRTTTGRVPPTSGQRWVLALTSLGFFMAMMDSMIVTTASTAIRADFGATVGQLQWMLNAYNVAVAAFLLIGVALGARLGYRRMYVVGLIVFVVGSVVAALSPTLDVLIAARVVQGIGASVMTPMSMAILTSAFPAATRGRALGIWSGVGGLALIIGPALGGVIVSTWGWNWIFWINVPIGLVGAYLSWRRLAESHVGGDWPHPLDSVLVVAASGAIVWALSESVTHASMVPPTVVGALGILLAVAFMVHQHRESTPMVPLGLFRSSAFSGGAVATFLLYAAMYGVVFLLPQYLQAVTGASALRAGLELLPWTGTLVVFSPLAGRIVDRLGERLVALVSLLLQAVGYLWLALSLSPGARYSTMVAPLVLSGMGISMAGPALQKAVLGAVDRTQTGIASGVFNMFRQLGGAMGTAIAVMVFTAFGAMAPVGRFAAGFRAAMVASAALVAAGAISALDLQSLRHRPLPTS